MKCNKLLFAEGQYIMNAEEPGWLLIARSANTTMRDGKGSDSCCKWDGTTQLLNLFASNDLATCAVMSDINEDVRGVLWLPVNPLEIIIARESSSNSKIQETELPAWGRNILWLVLSEGFSLIRSIQSHNSLKDQSRHKISARQAGRLSEFLP